MRNAARRKPRSLAAAAGLLALLVCASAADSRTRARKTPEIIIRAWPPAERNAARAMLEKYGRPEQFDRRALAWFDNGNWKRTIVYSRPLHLAEKDFLQQSIGYIVPNGRLDELKRFDPRLSVSTTAGEMTFSSNSEATNLLGLNLADEIVEGKRSVAQARAFFVRTSRLAAAGKSSPYRERLKFPVDNRRYMPPTGAD